MITALVIVLGLVVALLTVLVAGLLRSHADILRALHELGVGEHGATSTVGPQPVDFAVRDGVSKPRSDAAPTAIADLSGTDPWGRSTAIAVSEVPHRTLLLFLSSGCLTCANFWEALDDPDDAGFPSDIRPVVVAKGPEAESEPRLRELAPDGIPVLLSSEAWTDYEVPVAPYAILVEGSSGAVLGEGAAATLDQVRTLMGQALDDREDDVTVPWRRRVRGGGAARRTRIDDELRDAGIEPGDPSLYTAPSDASGEG